MKEINFPTSISQAVRLGLGELIPQEEPIPQRKFFKRIEDVTYDQLKDAYDLIPSESTEVDEHEEYLFAERLKELYTEHGYITDVLLREFQRHASDSFTDDLPHAETIALINDLIEETPALAHDKQFLQWANQVSGENLPSKEGVRPKGIHDTKRWVNTIARTSTSRKTRISKNKTLVHRQRGNYSKRGRKKGPDAPDRKMIKRQMSLIEKKMEENRKKEEFFQQTSILDIP